MEGESKKHGFFMLAEMLLIIVGITAALQLDNWTSNSEDRRNERALLKQLQSEFVQVQAVIYKSHEKLTQRDINGLNLYKSCGLEKVNYPEIDLLNMIVSLFSPSQLNLYQGALEDAINTGKLSLVKNNELRINLYAWKRGVIQIQKYEESTANDVSEFLREIYHILSFRNYDDNYYPEIGIGRSEFPSEHNDIFNTIYFENQVGVLFFRNKRLIEHYQENLVDPIDVILKLIDEELKKSTSIELTQKNKN